MSKPLHISIPRAGFVGYWDQFAHDNAAFINDAEMARLERSLRETGHAKHTAASNGDFDFTVIEPPAKAA